MLDPAGGFYSAQDADSEGEEGRFFVWTPERDRRGRRRARPTTPPATRSCSPTAYGVTERGNFEGRNILFVAQTAAEIADGAGLERREVGARARASARARCSPCASTRVKPGLDDKVLASWNGLMLAAFAEAARVLGRDDYQRIAEKNAEFVLSADARRRRAGCCARGSGGHAKLNGYLEDYAHYADGLLELYQTTFEPRWFAAARELADSILEHFADPSGGFFDTSDDHETLLVRPKGLQDGAMPSGGAMAAERAGRAWPSTPGRAATPTRRRRARAGAAPLMAAGSARLRALASAPRLQARSAAGALAIVGDDAEPLLAVVRSRYRPNLVVAAAASREAEPAIALLRGREPLDGRSDRLPVPAVHLRAAGLDC